MNQSSNRTQAWVWAILSALVLLGILLGAGLNMLLEGLSRDCGRLGSELTSCEARRDAAQRPWTLTVMATLPLLFLVPPWIFRRLARPRVPRD